MGATALLLSFVLAGQVQVPNEIAYFPGEYFHNRAWEELQRDVLWAGDGPTGILNAWSEDDLSEEQRVSILLGSSVFHDPSLLPIFIESIKNPSQRIRKAAVYGYRDLIGDQRPALRINQRISNGEVDQLHHEMTLVHETLRRSSLVAMWLAALLASEDQTLPGYQGLVMQREPRAAFAALSRVIGPEDLDLLVAVYPLVSERRVGLASLIEGLVIRRWTIRPRIGARTPSRASAVSEVTLRRADGWVRTRCAVDFEREIKKSLNALGVKDFDPTADSACPVWFGLLQQDQPEWWGTAALFLYRCGHKPSLLNVNMLKAKQHREARDDTVKTIRETQTYQRTDNRK